MSIDALQQWVASRYGRPLNQDELNQLARALNYSGGPISEALFNEAKRLVDEVAKANNIPVMSGGSTTPPFDMNTARTAVVNAIQAQYGVTLSPAQLQAVWEAVSAGGVTSTEQIVNAAMTWLSNPANQQTILGIGGTSEGGTETPGATPGATPGGTPGGTPGTTTTPPGTATSQPLDTETVNLLRTWWKQTFLRDPTDAELIEVGKRVNYTGGPITPAFYARIQGEAEKLMREGGWKPPEEPDFDTYLPTFSYDEFSFAEPPPPGYQAGPAFTPGAFAYGEQGPGAFQYGEFVAPSAEAVTQDPAYQRRLAEGQRALETSAASKGLLRTGATLKGLSDYAQQQASDEYAKAYQRQLGEYQTGRAGALTEYETGRQSYMDRYSRAYQEYLTNLENQRFAYSTGEQQRRSSYDEAQRDYDRKYKMAQDKYQTGYNKAFSEYQSRRSAAEKQYEQDWNYWKYLQDDAYKRAALRSGLSS